ncbi:hypothetical protein BT96DRAFT_1021106 [Gymnopus androsaceus JB14]|uniref:Uncharacterized protein n=1 Tax=Gymnopus androsaceus JB14 TaxID=1447944 RepID=A0A6A4HG84_9AGAR|nr:hypothetical protein BT96DRAFT_1021106 [Gymnopus androsaceus JB14]
MSFPSAPSPEFKSPSQPETPILPQQISTNYKETIQEHAVLVFALVLPFLSMSLPYIGSLSTGVVFQVVAAALFGIHFRSPDTPRLPERRAIAYSGIYVIGGVVMVNSSLDDSDAANVVASGEVSSHFFINLGSKVFMIVAMTAFGVYFLNVWSTKRPWPFSFSRPSDCPSAASSSSDRTICNWKMLLTAISDFASGLVIGILMPFTTISTLSLDGSFLDGSLLIGFLFQVLAVALFGISFRKSEIPHVREDEAATLSALYFVGGIVMLVAMVVSILKAPNGNANAMLGDADVGWLSQAVLTLVLVFVNGLVPAVLLTFGIYLLNVWNTEQIWPFPCPLTPSHVCRFYLTHVSEQTRAFFREHLNPVRGTMPTELPEPEFKHAFV